MYCNDVLKVGQPRVAICTRMSFVHYTCLSVRVLEVFLCVTPWYTCVEAVGHTVNTALSNYPDDNVIAPPCSTGQYDTCVKCCVTYLERQSRNQT